MRARRFAAFLIGILSIHLNLVGVDLACADHARRDVATHDAATMQHHAAPTSNEAAVADAEPCEIPAQPDCCRAMTSCAVTVVLDVESRSAAVASNRERVVPAAVGLLLSHTTPPDPPPPKA